ncbi:MAG: glucose-6-phosphate dehydrogenase [Desulfarculaceae bacterium]|nr:glucose-6-phosphate dehydrogenase [Desulfarculaceae bacterium]MCF8072975.1 glucose-6-phosphate dehydrogenase [Desulfarculaceae bacterium]MCF8100729.1 glucose-6-phosphate dehydrogenase [Desulfarculaceae bacterium]MCF8115467.1 glucose-6-phosphate dehydrogenase [Desulfarculaceae bacterium]
MAQDNAQREGKQAPASRRPEACAIVIFGASGDLTGRKLVPALYNLFANRMAPESFYICGAARSELSDEEFRAKMHAAVEQSGGDMAAWDDFAARLHYQSVIYDDPGSYQALAERLDRLDQEHEVPGNRIFECAIPPTLYMTVARMLAQSGLSGEERGWRRLVVEKPFGSDLASSQELNQAICQGFEEHQVFRIDHYLAKETVQNIMMFRFANAIFEPLWNRNYIEQVSILSAETLGVEHRAGYYEKAGVLRDMFQNHMMQLLALVAAEPPSIFAADRVRDEKTKLFRSLRPFPTDQLYDYLVLAQYEAGDLDGREYPAYRAEPGVDPSSLTPTYATMKVFVDNWRWQGVPFYITSGKRLAQKLTRIEIQFREVPHSLFRQVLGEEIKANRLVLNIQPNEEITLYFQAKQPGGEVDLRTVGLHFEYQDGAARQGLEAYEKALADAMLGDQMLFWRQDGVDLCWAFLDPVLEACESCGDRADRLHRYRAGSWGPRDAAKLWPGHPLNHLERY